MEMRKSENGNTGSNGHHDKVPDMGQENSPFVRIEHHRAKARHDLGHVVPRYF